MPTDPQPEEAATKPLAAAASAAGSYAQIQMYGRGARQRTDDRAEKQKPAEQDRPQTENGTPEQDPAAEPAAGGQMPAANAHVDLAEQDASAVTIGADLAAEVGVPVETQVAASAQDAAAAQARLVQGQLAEPPALAPPAAGMAPGL